MRTDKQVEDVLDVTAVEMDEWIPGMFHLSFKAYNYIDEFSVAVMIVTDTAAAAASANLLLLCSTKVGENFTPQVTIC